MMISIVKMYIKKGYREAAGKEIPYKIINGNSTSMALLNLGVEYIVVKIMVGVHNKSASFSERDFKFYSSLEMLDPMCHVWMALLQESDIEILFRERNGIAGHPNYRFKL